MPSIPIAQIKEGKRHRKDMGDLDRLIVSIRDVGLLHPVVLDSENRLIVGKRRLEAFKMIGHSSIPYVTARTITEVAQRLRAERDENTCREDLSPSVNVALGTEIEKLEKPEAKERQKQSKGPGQRGGKLPHLSTGKTRDKVGRALGMSAKTYEKAKAVVASGKKKLIEEMDTTGKVDAVYRKLGREKKQEVLEQKAAKTGDKSGDWRIIQGDCLVELAKLGTGEARLVFADPPYNIGVDYGQGKRADRLPDDEYLDWCRRWMAACRQILADDGSLWVMICDEYADRFGVMLTELGFYRRNWIKWYETFGVNCTKNFNRCSRHIFYCVRDRKRFVFNPDAVNRESDRQTKYKDTRANPAGKLWDNVWQIPRLVGTATERIPDFPTQIPLAVTRPIVNCASEPGDLVVDPFAGSASTGVAAVEGKRRFVGIEKSTKFVKLAKMRLKGT